MYENKIRIALQIFSPLFLLLDIIIIDIIIIIIINLTMSLIIVLTR